MKVHEGLIKELDPIREAGALLKELHRRFGDRMAIGTSGQLSGTALILLALEAGFTPRAFVCDTGRLFPETYALFKAIEEKYNLRIESFAPDAAAVDAMVAEHGEFLFFDSKEKQELCCRLRKVHPNDRALDTLDVWVTGLRSDQSPGRAKVPRLSLIAHGPSQRPILKVSPLADWTEARVRAYLEERGAPSHALLEAKLPGGWYYESLGCVLCTTPIGPNEPRRAGRWRWFNSQDPSSKECGLHLPRKEGA